MGENRKTIGERARDLLEQIGQWLDEVLPGPQPVPVPVPVRPRR